MKRMQYGSNTASNRDRTGDLILTMDALYLLSYGNKHGSPNRARTCDNSINSRVLYQLSYQGIMVEPSGIEPLTSCLQGRRSPS
jgi:hypothetical protein